jgi:serine/threonine protein kinase
MKLLGTGSYGKVYKSNESAIKISSGSNYKVFMRELVIMRYLNINSYKYSPILHAFDVDKMIIKMEFMEITFNKYIKSTQDPKKRASYLMSLCQAVNQLHALGIVHADLKLSNVMLRVDTVSLIDFGLSAPPLYTLSKYTTKAYEDPAGGKNYESDIYSLGIIFLEVLSGDRFKEVPKKNDIKDRLSRIDPSHVTLVKKMISKIPKKRPDMKYILNFFNQDHGTISAVEYSLEILGINKTIFKWISSVMEMKAISGPFDASVLTILICSLVPDENFKHIQIYSVALLIIYSGIYSGAINIDTGVALCPSKILRDDRRELLINAVGDLLSNNNLIMTIVKGIVIIK